MGKETGGTFRAAQTGGRKTSDQYGVSEPGGGKAERKNL